MVDQYISIFYVNTRKLTVLIISIDQLVYSDLYRQRGLRAVLLDIMLHISCYMLNELCFYMLILKTIYLQVPVYVQHNSDGCNFKLKLKTLLKSLKFHIIILLI